MPDLGGQPIRCLFKNPLMSLDTTLIDLCVTMFDWDKFRLTKEAALLLDHDGYLPSFAVIRKQKACGAGGEGDAICASGDFGL